MVLNGKNWNRQNTIVIKAIKQSNQNVILWWKVFNKHSKKGGQMTVAVTEKQTEKQ